MKIIGIICEYNPFHLGHQKQLRGIRQEFGADCGIVCLMSGNYVQRGAPAIFDKSLRAQAAIACGADLVLELPVPYALSSAEGFAAGGVRILSHFCDGLCFGCESGDADSLLATAKALLSPHFPAALRRHLDAGKSFPAARQGALEDLGTDARLLSQPNDILAVEYCKAILSQGSGMVPLPIHREGSYHDTAAHGENPSATALRQLLLEGKAWEAFVPEAARDVLRNAPLHAIAPGERAILARLRSMSDSEFEALPYGSEGLWRKLMHAVHSCGTLEEIIAATKSKRYTRTRIDRMILCAYLGITLDQMLTHPPYTRVLAFSETGRSILKKARLTGDFPHIGEDTGSPYWALEQKWDDLYGLFRLDAPEPPGREAKRRVYYKP